MTFATLSPTVRPRGAIAAAPRDAGLDLLRAGAILLVYSSHVTDYFTAGRPRVQMAFDQLGMVGVELFFSLSGFLIGGLLIRLARDGLTGRGIGRFLVRRWFRTLPLYYAVLVAACFGYGRWEWRPFLFLQTFGPFDTRILTVSWSLVMEEYFYLFFPFLMLAAVLLSAGRLRGVQCAGAAAAGLAAACIGARLAHLTGHLPIPAENFQYHPFYRMDCAAYGVGAACIVAWWPQGAWRRGAVRAAMGAAVLGVIVVLNWLFLNVTDPGFQRAWGLHYWSYAYLALDHTAADVAGAVLVLVLLDLPALPQGLVTVTGWISRLSYSIYLVHVPIKDLAEPYMSGMTPVDRLVTVTSLVLVTSLLTYMLVEQPFLRLRDRLAPG
jgi:peptidoglycan/LPS O-acetylase OafA/YrhL